MIKNLSTVEEFTKEMLHVHLCRNLINIYNCYSSIPVEVNHSALDPWSCTVRITSGSAVITNDASKDFPASVGEKLTGNRTNLLGLKGEEEL